MILDDISAFLQFQFRSWNYCYLKSMIYWIIPGLVLKYSKLHFLNKAFLNKKSAFFNPKMDSLSTYLLIESFKFFLKLLNLYLYNHGNGEINKKNYIHFTVSNLFSSTFSTSYIIPWNEFFKSILDPALLRIDVFKCRYFMCVSNLFYRILSYCYYIE